MLKLLDVTHLGRKASVGYLSLQPDHSVSFGLRDKAYVSSRWRERRFLWNAYNRITVKYEMPSDPDALLPVQNPHFTFHPAAMFHLKSNKDRKTNDKAIFEGFVPVAMVLQQQSEMPWIRAISRPIHTIKIASGARETNIATESLNIEAPALMPRCSASMEIDFIRPSDVEPHRSSNVWEYIWGEIGVRVKIGQVAPQVATLSWFHSA